ncbi:ammonium transporter, Amt family [Methylomarinovum tepidoasis]|uniref:Ammonium transporter n=1 Tax=Methylomarinovum tepidoasis TaxID=2840183 RepID=A0AAU9CYJ0_9GAMM|nr:ammonium transporter [Methylomarinovum sp. IN45]BCX87714.1 ammonium transporter, Amt family [Methylomarinovum sp. IN45]
MVKRLPVLLLALPPAAGADDFSAADTAWILTTTALVLFMTLPGLALFYGGLVRSKNVLSILGQCVAIAALASVLWLIGGYSLAFGEGGAANAFIGGLDKVFLRQVGTDSLSGSLPEIVFVAFQMTFAIITPALVVGGFAERMRFAAVLWFSALWLLLVYVPVCHWVWGGGWLADLGVMDFAGGIVVHLTCGVAAIVSALVLGPRRGFPQTPMPPHNMTLTVTGAGMLWVGWYGFNGGSALAASGAAGMALFVTHIAAAAGVLSWMFIEWWRFGKPSVLGMVTGMVAGLGTITPASGFVGPAGALVLGILAGGVCFTATQWIKRVLHIDDSLDVFPVHGVGGIFGSLATGVLAAESLGGFGLAEDHTIGQQLGVQVLALVSVGAWCGLWTFALLKLLDGLLGLRVTPEAETEGLDITEHEETAYHL